MLIFYEISYNGKVYAHDVAITIHLRGVYESKISLLSLTRSGTFKPTTEGPTIKNGETTRILVPEKSRPGEFVLRFDYKEKESSTPYPSEKYVFIGDQGLELWVSPAFCNNADSTKFQPGERENAAFSRFSRENGRKKEKLGLLRQFLMNYDDTRSAFYREGIREYEHRRKDYNAWLNGCIEKDKALFVSSVYRFQFVAPVQWEGSEKERIISVIGHYFDGTDFNDPIIIKTSQMNEMMNSYVNLYGQMATTVALRDSLIPLAAARAIELAKRGAPAIYGWMVDYFYRGFESNNIPAGMKVLEPYMNDPACPTSKRAEIARRLKGFETLVPGSTAPDIVMKNPDGTVFELNTFSTPSRYILLVFWSANCSHCLATVDTLYPGLQVKDIRQKVSVVAISLDETEPEVKAWDQKIKALPGWRHLRAPEGVNSKVAADYYILATPVMVLVDSSTKKIVALPSSPLELMQDLW